MTAVRLFTDDQVKEIVALHKQGKAIVYIAERFGHRATVRKIVAGTAYRDVTHNERRRTCICPSCVNRARDEANFDVARGDHRRAVLDLRPGCHLEGQRRAGETWRGRMRRMRRAPVTSPHTDLDCDIPSVDPIDDATKHAARLTVARWATDADDLRLILAVLGLSQSSEPRACTKCGVEVTRIAPGGYEVDLRDGLCRGCTQKAEKADRVAARRAQAVDL